MRSSKAKIKGTYWENRCAKLLNQAYKSCGFEFRRTLGSGSSGVRHKEQKGDIVIRDSLHGTHYDNQVEIECKLRSSFNMGCLYDGNSVIDNFIRELFYKSKGWVLLIKTGKNPNKTRKTTCEEWVLLPSYKVDPEDLKDWNFYPDRLKFIKGKNYAFMEFSKFLKIEDGYKYLLK